MIGGFSGADATCFLANPGGFLLTCLDGFPGLQLDAGEPSTWGKFPVVLLAGIQCFSVERLWLPLLIRATLAQRVHSPRCTFAQHRYSRRYEPAAPVLKRLIIAADRGLSVTN